MADKNVILMKVYDFLKEVIPVLSRFPRSQKFLLGDNIQKIIMMILELTISAFYAKDLIVKKESLTQINLKIEILRYYLRLSFELGYLNSSKYNIFAEKLQEIGRMNGGWLKHINIKLKSKKN